MIFGVPAGDRGIVVLVDQQPLLTIALRASPHEGEPAGELATVEVEVHASVGDGLDRVVGLGELPRPPVPDDDVAAAVLAGRNHTLEVEVVQWVVLDVDRHPANVGVERRSFRHRPADSSTPSASSRRS